MISGFLRPLKVGDLPRFRPLTRSAQEEPAPRHHRAALKDELQSFLFGRFLLGSSTQDCRVSLQTIHGFGAEAQTEWLLSEAAVRKAWFWGGGAFKWPFPGPSLWLQKLALSLPILRRRGMQTRVPHTHRAGRPVSLFHAHHCLTVSPRPVLDSTDADVTDSQTPARTRLLGAREPLTLFQARLRSAGAGSPRAGSLLG